jgi:hypothetical protein
MMKEEIREALAAQEHDRWSRWMRYMFAYGTFNNDGTWTMNAVKVKRWQRQLETPYEHLSEAEKDSDRKEADLTIELLSPFIKDDAEEILRQARRIRALEAKNARLRIELKMREQRN